MPNARTGVGGPGESGEHAAQDQTGGPGDTEPAHAARVHDADGVAISDAPRRMRFTRRRLLIAGGVAAAGAATIVGLRAWGDSGGSGGSGSGVTDFPVLSVEPPPDVQPADWVLKVDGLVERPLTIDRVTWSRLERLMETKDFHCVTGWSVDNLRWRGVAPSVLLEQAGVRPEASYVAFHALGRAGSEYVSTLPMHLVLAPDTLLADTLDGVPLPAGHGGPLRLVVPVQLGYKNVKWVVRIEVTQQLVPGYWEQRGYPEDAPVRGG